MPGFDPARLFWDAAYAAGEHRRHWEPPAVPEELAELAASGELPPGARVLDIGCGAGTEVLYLAGRGCRPLGLDLSLTALAVARRRPAAGARWCCATAFSLPLSDRSLDAVLDRGCLHTVERHRRRRFAAELFRVLAPGGILLLRGAAADDAEAGLVGIDRREVDRCFPPHRFRRGALRSITMRAAAGDLPATLVLLHRRSDAA